MKPAICTQCGAQIEVDETKEAGICKSCGTAFITEKAINNYITQNTTVHNTVHNVTENVTKIILGDEKDAGDDHFKRGLTQLRLKHYGDANSEFEKATKKSPECAKYWFYLFYADLSGFESFYCLDSYSTREAFKSFKALASDNELKEYEKEFGIYLNSYEDFAYGYFAKIHSSLESDAEISLIYKIHKMKLECKNAEIAKEIIKKVGENKVKFKDGYNTQCDYIFVLNSVKNVLGEQVEMPQNYFDNVNTLDGNGVLQVLDPHQFLKDGVFEVSNPVIKKIFLHSIEGVKKLVVKDNKIYSKCYQLNKYAGVDIVEVDASCNSYDCIKGAMVMACGLLILPEHITTLEPFSYTTYSTDIDHRFNDLEKNLPNSGCIIHYKGVATGGLSHTYKDKNVLRDTVETKVDKWAYVSNGKVYNCSPSDDRLKKYFGENHGLVAAEEQKAKEGCYVATCVYGSYDCPEVWVLRRYRDFSLKNSALGRTFIKVYYAISPKIVKIFGKYAWFNKIFKKVLDKKVNKLYKKGYSNTPYNDNN